MPRRGRADPQYPARAGSNIAPSQCTITFPETFAEDRGIGLPIGVRADRFGGEVAAGHHDGLAPHSLDQRDLLDVRVDDPSPLRDAWRQLVGVGATRDLAAHGLGFGDRAGDQLLRGLPVETHPALGGVHRFGDRADPTTTDGDGTPGSSPSRSSPPSLACCRPAGRRPRARRRTGAGSATGQRVARTGSALRACGGRASRPPRGSITERGMGTPVPASWVASFVLVAPSAPP